MHPKVPTSWSGMFLTVFFLTVGGYLGGGVAINRSRGEEHWLPNPLFWAALGVRTPPPPPRQSWWLAAELLTD